MARLAKRVYVRLEQMTSGFIEWTQAGKIFRGGN